MALTLPHRSRKGESTCCAVSFGIMSGLFQEAYLDGSQLDGYLIDDELRDMSEIFDLNGASQAPEDSRSRGVSGDYELPVLPGLTERERLESPSVATMTATEHPSDNDYGLFAGADSETELEMEEEDSDAGDAGDDNTATIIFPNIPSIPYLISKLTILA
jgi:hypothetical protein